LRPRFAIGGNRSRQVLAGHPRRPEGGPQEVRVRELDPDHRGQAGQADDRPEARLKTAMATHELKSWPEPFQAVWTGRKRAEFRRDDRGYGVGDRLELREWDPATGEYTGFRLTARVTHLARGPA